MKKVLIALFFLFLLFGCERLFTFKVTDNPSILVGVSSNGDAIAVAVNIIVKVEFEGGCPLPPGTGKANLNLLKDRECLFCFEGGETYFLFEVLKRESIEEALEAVKKIFPKGKVFQGSMDNFKKIKDEPTARSMAGCSFFLS